MKRRPSPYPLMIGAGLLLASAGWAQEAAVRPPASMHDQTRMHANERMRDQDVYGHELMTAEELSEYRNRMRSASTAKEREQIRTEHHAQMQARAKERGVTLPDEPRAGRGPLMGRGGAASAPGTGGPGGPPTGMRP
jgi:hypothetical protein